MSEPLPLAAAPAAPRSRLTLALSTILHGFTHAYGAMLVPLYLLMVADLRLGGVKSAAVVVTVYGLVYNLGSYAAGVLADRYDRRVLLGVGLLGNAAAILAMGLTRRYEVVLGLGVVAGLAGTLFHPAANALIPAHFPKHAGLAIGLLGAGSGLGFFAGPQYAGWRAESAHWQLPGIAVADWQRPCVELGAAGVVFGVAFLLLAREVRSVGAHGRVPSSGTGTGIGTGEDARPCVPTAGLAFLRAAAPSAGDRAHGRVPQHYEHVPVDPPAALGPTLRNRVLALAAVLGCRDFAGVAGISLASIYLQKAHGMTARQAGFVVGTMMLLSMVVNPLAVWVSPGRRRLPALVVVLLAGASIVTTVPWVPLRHTLAVLCAFQTFQMGSYAISDAATLERVAPAVRGRVVGLFLTVAGTFASTGPWVMGWWTDRLGARASDPLAYAGAFGTLALMMAVAACFSTPLIARLGAADHPPVDPLTEITPATLESVG